MSGKYYNMVPVYGLFTVVAVNRDISELVD